jgi:transposase
MLQSLDPQVRSYITAIESELRETRSDRQSVQARYESLEIRYDHLKEEYRLLLYKRFGKSSEKDPDTDQQSLFEEAEITADASVVETGRITVETHTRQKRGRKPIDESVPRVAIVHDIPEAEKHCACGHDLVRIGEEVSERLQIIPEQIYVERHIRPKYACHSCEGSGDEEKPAVRIAPAPPAIIPGSIATVGTVGVHHRQQVRRLSAVLPAGETI